MSVWVVPFQYKPWCTTEKSTFQKTVIRKVFSFFLIIFFLISLYFPFQELLSICFCAHLRVSCPDVMAYWLEPQGSTVFPLCDSFTTALPSHFNTHQWVEESAKVTVMWCIHCVLIPLLRVLKPYARPNESISPIFFSVFHPEPSFLWLHNFTQYFLFTICWSSSCFDGLSYSCTSVPDLCILMLAFCKLKKHIP